jgi:hypothetical protein
MLMQKAKTLLLMNNQLDSDKKILVLRPIELGKLQGLIDLAIIRNQNRAILSR